MQLADGAEEKAISRHRVVDAGAGEDQAIVAAEGGEQDCDSHQNRSRSPEGLLHDGGPYPVIGRVLNAPRQHGRAVGITVQW